MHNQVTAQGMNVNLPKTKDQLQQPDFTLNGYFDKDPVSLKNGFKSNAHSVVPPVDARLYNQNENFNQQNQNTIYQPNQALLGEIAEAKSKREYQRTQRHYQDNL